MEAQVPATRRRPKAKRVIILAVSVAVLLAIVLLTEDKVLGVVLSSRRSLTESAFELKITADKASYRIGEKPKLTAMLTNRSGHAVYLVPPLEKSDMGRSPIVKYTVTPPANALPLKQLEMCGNSNPIKLSDFGRVENGGALNLAQGWPDMMVLYELDRGPGDYTIQLTYSTDATDPSQWIGGPLTESDRRAKTAIIAPRLVQVPRFTVKSNVLHLKFDTEHSGVVDSLHRGT